MKSELRFRSDVVPKGGTQHFWTTVPKLDHSKVKSWVPIPILIPVNRGANPGYFPDPGQIGIPRFPGIPAESGSGQNPEYFPDPGPIGIGKIPAIFPAKSGRDGAGIRGFRGLAPPTFSCFVDL